MEPSEEAMAQSPDKQIEIIDFVMEQYLFNAATDYTVDVSDLD